MFSTGFSTGDREGSRMMVRFLGTLSLSVLCHPARSIRTTPWAFAATLQLISSRCICMARVLAKGSMRAAPLAPMGPMAPNR